MQIQTSLKVLPELVGSQFINLTCNGNKYRIQLDFGNRHSFVPQFVRTVSAIIVLPEYQNVLKILADQDNQLHSSKNQYSLKQCLKYQQQAKTYFGRSIEIDYTQYGMKLLIHDNDSIITQQLSILDSLKMQHLLKIFKTGFDNLSEKLKHRVNRKFKKYINQTKRSSQDKAILTQIHKHHKTSQKELVDEDNQKQKRVSTQQKKSQNKIKEPPKRNNKKIQVQKVPVVKLNNNDNDDDWEDIQDTQQEIKQEKPTRKIKQAKVQTITIQNKPVIEKIKPEKEQPNVQTNKFRKQKKYQKYQKNEIGQQQNKGRNKRSSSKPFRGGFSRQKRQIDPRIALGIKGDTNDGWRQRARPSRIPHQQLLDKNPHKMQKARAQKPKKQELKTQETTEKSQHIQEQKSNENKKTTIQLPKSVELHKVFSYPQDGKNFKFQVGKNYTLKVNDSFIIKIDSAGFITIHNGQKGYIRKGVIDPLNNGFMADGLTICFDGSCNLEDGGQTFGDPKIQDFTKTDNQWFTLEKLDIFSQK